MNSSIMLCIRFRSCLSLLFPNSDGLVAIMLTMSVGVLGRVVGVGVGVGVVVVVVLVVGVLVVVVVDVLVVAVAVTALVANGRTVGMVGRHPCEDRVGLVVVVGSALDWKFAGNGRARGGDGGRCCCCCCRC